MSNIEVSVLMCVFREESKHLREAIESILNQTYRNFEFVIVADDPNCDRVISIVREYSEKDNRVYFIINRENIGLTKSLNVGLAQCNGDYIVRMDADDVSVLERIKIQLSFMKKHQNINACGTYIQLIDQDDKIIGKKKNPSNNENLNVQSIFRTPIFHPTSIFKRIINGQPLKYDETFRVAQDFALWSSLEFGSFSNIPEYLLKYRVSSSQISCSRIDEQIAATKKIQYYNLKKLGLELSPMQKKVFEFLFSNGSFLPKQEEVKALLKIIYISLSSALGKEQSSYFILNTYTSYMFKMNSSFILITKGLIIFARDIKYINIKSFGYLFYRGVKSLL